MSGKRRGSPSSRIVYALARGSLKDENVKFKLCAKRQIATPIPGEEIKVTRKARNGNKVRIFGVMTRGGKGEVSIPPPDASLRSSMTVSQLAKSHYLNSITRS